MKNYRLLIIKYFYFLFAIVASLNAGFAQTHELADKYFEEAELAAKVKDYTKAAELFEKAAQAEKASSVPRLEKLYLSLGNASSHLKYIGNKEKAMVLQKEYLENVEKALGKDHLRYEIGLNTLIDLYEAMGQYDKALPLYLEALKNTEQALGREHPDYGLRLNNLALLYQNMGQYDKALPLYLEALKNTEMAFGREHATYRIRLNNLAALYQIIGQYDKALPLYLEALKNTEKEHPDYGLRLSNLASLYQVIGQYDKSLPLYLEALKNIEKEHPDYELRLSNLAGLYEAMGQYDKTLPVYLEALKNTEKTLGREHPNYGLRLNNLAGLYEAMGQYDKSLPLYLEALKNTEKALGREHPDYGLRLANLGVLYKIMGQYDKSLPLYLEALKNTEKVLGKEHPAYGLCLSNLAGLYEAIGQYDRALPLYLEALKNTEKALGREHPDYRLRLSNLAGLYGAMGQYDKSLPLYLDSYENIKRQMNMTFDFLSEQEKGNYIKMIDGNFEVYQSFFAKYYSQNPSVSEPAYDIELLTKGLILSSSQQMRNAIEESGNAEALRLYEEWFVKKSGLARQYAIPVSQRSSDLKIREDEAENLEKQLIKLSTTFKENIQLGKTEWKDIQATLGDNETAIEFASFQYRNDKNWTDSTLYIALVLKKGYERPVLVPLFEQRQLDSLLVSGSDAAKVAGLYRGSEGKSTAKNHKKLYDLVWKPLEAYIGEKETVHFAPSGSLHQIAFSAIVTPDGQYLSDKYRLNQVSTTAKIIQEHKKGELKDITLYGGIDYEAEGKDLLAQAQHLKNDAVISRSLTTDLERGTSGWDYLRGTRDEVGAIKGTSEKAGVLVNYFTGKTALEERFKQQSGKKSPAILHVATHGFFFPDPEKQYKEHQLLLQEERNVYKLSDNPLNRSGLLFSGANTAWKGEPVTEGLEDGILTAYEASHVSLPNTHLVVLSACETGLGDIKGSEGVFGLQRAFKLAGAEYLLMSLWKVPDQETAEFMIKFYELLFSTKDIPGSYDKTQRYMKGKYPEEPYKWAAFVLVR